MLFTIAFPSIHLKSNTKDLKIANKAIQNCHRREYFLKEFKITRKMRIMFTNWEIPFTKGIKPNLSFSAKFACLFLLLFSINLQKVQAQQDLSITQIASVDSAGVGDEVTFTITLMNDGTTTATGVTVKNVLPTNATYVFSYCICRNF